jgi:hypothetical protein
MNKSTIVMMFVVILAVLPSTQAFCWWCLAEGVAGVAGGLLGRELEDSVEVINLKNAITVFTLIILCLGIYLFGIGTGCVQ